MHDYPRNILQNTSHNVCYEILPFLQDVFPPWKHEHVQSLLGNVEHDTVLITASVQAPGIVLTPDWLQFLEIH